MRICTVLSSSTNPQRSSATPPVCLLERYSASTQIQGTSFNQRFLKCILRVSLAILFVQSDICT
nr:MAG TPA: hypothetical protein [Caudoviricetes sp.]